MDGKKIILDVDCGVDDALAIILAMHSQELEVLAITTVSGNTHVDHCTKNVLRVLSVLGSENPPLVARGEDRPLVKEARFAASVHGNDGLGDLGDDYYPPLDWGLLSSESAVELLPKLILEHPGEVTLVATGPLTNLAKAIQAQPTTMSQTKEIVIMGGAVKESGNIPPLKAAEFNVYADPDALDVVLGFCAPVTLVPLDVTHKTKLLRDRAERELSAGPGTVAQFALDCNRKYMDYHRDDEGMDGAYLHDPLAVGVVIDPSLVRLEPMRIYVETKDGMTRGMTVAFGGNSKVRMPPNCKVAMSVGSDRFLDLFIDRIKG